MTNSRYLALRRAVLARGLKDAVNAIEPEWIGSSDFAEVSDLALVEPAGVLRRIRRAERPKVAA